MKIITYSKYNISKYTIIIRYMITYCASITLYNNLIFYFVTRLFTAAFHDFVSQ